MKQERKLTELGQVLTGVCLTCRGTGDIPYKYKPCPYCNGSGKAKGVSEDSKPCAECIDGYGHTLEGNSGYCKGLPSKEPTKSQSFESELKEVLDQHITYRDSGNPYIELDIPTCNKLVEAITSAHRTEVERELAQARIEELKKMRDEWGYGEYPNIDPRYGMDWEAWIEWRTKQLKKGQSND